MYRLIYTKGRALLSGLLAAGLLALLGGCSPVLTSPLASPRTAASGALGQAAIRILPAGTGRTVYPQMSSITGYILNFTHDDGDTAPEAVLTGEGRLVVDLKAGFWTISAGALTGDGGASPVLRGSVRVKVVPGELVSAELLLDAPVGEGRAGDLSYAVDFPRDRVSSARLILSVLGNTGTFIPLEVIDLLGAAGEGNSARGKLSLPGGYYRIDIRLAAVYPFAGRTEVAHIYPGMETALPPVVFTEANIPSTPYLTGTAALKEYLEGLPPNTEKTPYPVRVAGVDLGSTESTGDTLRTLCEALSRYAALDLRDCTGTAIQSMTKNAKVHKEMITALILPETLTEVEMSGFFGYDALVSAELPRVQTLEKGAFKGCARLESVYMPELITIVDGTAGDNGAFRECAALRFLYLPKARTIGNYAFYKCDALEALSLPSAVSLGSSSLRYGKNLSAVDLPVVTDIGNNAFANCPKLSYLSLGGEVPALGGSIFSADMFPRDIFVPASAVAAYQNTTLKNWTGPMKERIRAAP